MRLLFALCLLPLLPASGCRPSTPPPSLQELRVLWEQDPAAARQRLEGIHDAVVRAGLVLTIVQDHPHQAADLCALLQDRDFRHQCQRVTRQSHLWERADDGGHRLAAQAAPPSGPQRNECHEDSSGVTGLSPIFTGSRHVPVSCPGDEAQALCQVQHMEQGLMDGDATVAEETAWILDHCLSIPQVRWRGECFFMAADASIMKAGTPRRAGPHEDPDPRRGRPRPLRMERVELAVSLCLSSSPFTLDCMDHLYLVAARYTPLAQAPAADWRDVLTFQRGLSAVLRPLDEAVAQRELDLFWSRVITAAYTDTDTDTGTDTGTGTDADELTGNPLAFLPPQAQPHLRAALAWRTVRDHPGSDLAALVAIATTRLHRRSTISMPSPLPPVQEPPAWSCPWLDVEPAPAWVHFLGNRRRATSDDPVADLTIAILEVAAHERPTDLSLPMSALDHSDPVVRWTAARRLLREEPAGLARRLAQDDDPRLRALARLPRP